VALIADPIFTDYSALNTTAESLGRGQLRFSLSPSSLETGSAITPSDVTLAATTPRDQPIGGGFTLDVLTTGGAAATSQQLIGTASSHVVQQSARLLAGPTKPTNHKHERLSGVATGQKKNRRANL
jgi:hypothetical protein